MKIALCNELLTRRDLASQCELTATLGYDGLEIAPFTLDAERPHKIPRAKRLEIRRTIESAGLNLAGLHWLLLCPKGLSLTEPDSAIRERTVSFMCDLVALCGELGGSVLVHGSPKQRWLWADAELAEQQKHWVTDGFAAAGEAARAAGVTYCIEPLAPPQANFITTVAEAAAITDVIGNPALRTMIDTGAARANPLEEPAETLIGRYVPSGHVTHIQFRDRTRRGPGLGEDRFAGILSALAVVGYDGWTSVEPIDPSPDGEATAAFCAGYLRGLQEASGL